MFFFVKDLHSPGVKTFSASRVVLVMNFTFHKTNFRVFNEIFYFHSNLLCLKPHFQHHYPIKVFNYRTHVFQIVTISKKKIQFKIFNRWNWCVMTSRLPLFVTIEWLIELFFLHLPNFSTPFVDSSVTRKVKENNIKNIDEFDVKTLLTMREISTCTKHNWNIV